MKKPISSTTHGILDYAFTGIQLAAPRLLNLNQKVVNTYTALGANFLAVNAATETPVSLKPLISFKTHQKLDASFLGGLALLTFVSPIRKNKKELLFHLSFLALAIAHYALTDYDE